MTIKEFIYDYYFDKPNVRKKNKEDVVFKIIRRGDDIKHYWLLYRGDPCQPTELYDKKVCKFWIEARRNHFVICVLYED